MELEVAAADRQSVFGAGSKVAPILAKVPEKLFHRDTLSTEVILGFAVADTARHQPAVHDF